jgi:uncharacterized protein YbjT (DUF2867 family)
MQVLVAGGTGMLGAPVVRHLISCGHRVRVLTRAPEKARARIPGAELIQADVTQPATLKSVASDCDALHVSLRGANDFDSYDAVERDGLKALLASASAAGVRRVTYLSGAGNTAGHEHLLPVRIKLEAEAAIAASGIPYTCFRATHFMESLDLFMRGRTANILGRQPHRYHYLAASDFAQLVEHALRLQGAENQTLYAFGPEPFSMREALARYVAELHPRGRVATLPLPMARIIAAVTRNRDLRFAAELFAGFQAIGESGDPAECDRLLGKPRTTLSAWLQARRSHLPVRE